MTLEQAQAIAKHVETKRKKAGCLTTDVELVSDKAATMQVHTDVADPRAIGRWLDGSGALMTQVSFFAAGVWLVRFILVPKADVEAAHGS